MLVDRTRSGFPLGLSATAATRLVTFSSRLPGSPDAGALIQTSLRDGMGR